MSEASRRDRRIELPQGTIEYGEVGRGPVVLFVHGLLVSGGLWSGVAERLAPTHRCIVPEWPLGSHRLPMRGGVDLSPAGVARLVAEFMAALELEDVTLVGNDTGGAICQLVAADHGARLARLVLTNCDALEVFPPRAFAHLSIVARIPGAMALLSQALLRVPPLRRLRLAYGALSKRPIPQATLRAWVEPGARDARVRADAAQLMRGISPEVTLDAVERLARFPEPILLLWAREDRFFTLDLATRLQQRLPTAELREVHDAFTFSPLDQPEVLAGEIRQFAA